MVMSLITPPGPTNTPVPLAFGTQVADNSNEFVGLLQPIDSAWTTYTPVWTATAAPSLGNGTITGRFVRFGNIGFFNGILTFGGTTTPGTGPFAFSLPLTWSAVGTVPRDVIGDAFLFDVSVTTRYVAMISVASATTIAVSSNAATADVGGLVPFTFASGDTIRWSGVVELV